MKGIVFLLGLGAAGLHYFIIKLTELELKTSSSEYAVKKGLTDEALKNEIEERRNRKSVELFCFRNKHKEEEGKQRHVVVVGGGIVGVTTAYYLSHDFNYKVTLIEKEGRVAASTSWGNSGVMDLTFDTPLATPSNIHIALLSLLPFRKKDDQFEYFHLHKMELMKDFSFWKWSYHFVRKSYFRSVIDRAHFLQAMKRYSSSQFFDLLSEENIELDIKKGVIELSTSEEELTSSLLLQQRHSVDCERLNRAAVCEKEPILRSIRKSFVGAIYTPNDITSECPKFTSLLTDILQQKYNVTTMFNSEVKNLNSIGGTVKGVSLTSGEEISADAVVLCTASDINSFPIHNLPFDYSEHQDVKMEIQRTKYIPIFPMRGYSIRIPLSYLKPSMRPSSVIVKDHVYISPINDQEVNVASIGEFQTSVAPLTYSADKHISSSFSSFVFNYLSHSFLKEYRDRGDDHIFDDRVWMGRRPLSADGVPVISKIAPGLFVNSGHGMYGWMLSCASGKIAATIIAENFKHGGISPKLFKDYLFVDRF